MAPLKYDPPWLQEQRGLTYQTERTKERSPFRRKSDIVATYIDELEALGERATHPVIRALLKSLNRGYATNSVAISRLLHGAGKGDPDYIFPNGHRVSVNDAKGVRQYKSLNKAADEEGCSPESVRQWAKSGKPNRKGQVWAFVDPARERSKRKKPNRAK